MRNHEVLRIEVSMREIFGQYARDCAAPSVANYVARQLGGFRNPNMTKIIVLTRSFNDAWASSLEADMRPEVKDAIDSIYSNRNLIAHGRDTGITFVRIQNYYQKALEIVEFIAQRCEGS
jgi:hypothetical protein